MNSMLKSAVVLGALAAAIATHASPIRYTVTATGSGTLDGTSFTNATITLTALGDTSNVSVTTTYPIVYTVPVTATATVSGVGTDTLTDSLSALDNQAQNDAGLYDGTVGGNILLAFNGAFGSYDLKSFIGPTGNGTANQPGSGIGDAFKTAGGTFTITSATNALFSAGPVNPTPEPSALAALGVGLVALARRRKRA